MDIHECSILVNRNMFIFCVCKKDLPVVLYVFLKLEWELFFELNTFKIDLTDTNLKIHPQFALSIDIEIYDCYGQLWIHLFYTIQLFKDKFWISLHWSKMAHENSRDFLILPRGFLLSLCKPYDISILILLYQSAILSWIFKLYIYVYNRDLWRTLNI